MPSVYTLFVIFGECNMRFKLSIDFKNSIMYKSHSYCLVLYTHINNSLPFTKGLATLLLTLRD